MSTTPGQGSGPDDEGPDAVTVLVDGGRGPAVRAAATRTAPGKTPGSGSGGGGGASGGEAAAVRPDGLILDEDGNEDEHENEDGNENDDGEGDGGEGDGPPTQALSGLDVDGDHADRTARRRPGGPAPAPAAMVEAPPPVATPAWEARPRRAAPAPAVRRARREAGGDRESFLRRHLIPPGTVAIVVIVLLVGAATGFTSAFIWAGSDNGKVQTAPVAPPPVGRPAADTPEAETTTTTKPDLSPDALTSKLAPSVWTVATFNSSGQPVQGSAFVAGSANGQGLLITSLAVVEASTRQPTPEIVVAGTGFKGPAVLWTWDEGRDLALLVVTRTGAPAPPWLTETSKLRDGDKVFAVSGEGKLAAGVVTAAPDKAVQHNIFVNDGLRGSPLVNVKGEVVAVMSATFAAGGTPTDTRFFGVPIAGACAGILRCGGTGAAPDGAARTTTTKPS